MQRSVRIITSSLQTGVGPLSVAQPLPVHALRQLDPFLLLHHAGPQTFSTDDEVHRIDPHPHRGFEPITFVYRGSVHHRDSLGNDGTIGPGEVQWITSGSGIIHSEGPTEQIQREGGEVELIQLWVNLPAAQKMCTPGYQELRAASIPVLQLCEGNLALHLVSGLFQGHTGPASTHSNVITAMGAYSAGLNAELQTPETPTFALYVLDGMLKVNGEHSVGRHQLAVFNNDGTSVHVEAQQDGHILLLAGEPLLEPIAQYGPFVMNTEEEIHQAIQDFRDGKMGTLDY